MAQELTTIKVELNCDGKPMASIQGTVSYYGITPYDKFYEKPEVDDLLAEKDKVIAELKAQKAQAEDDCAYWKTMAQKNAADNAVMAKQRAEALKRERHNKYKRCLAMAQEWRNYATFCGIQSSCHNHRGFGKTAEKWTWKECHAWRCVKRLQELAEKFKEAK